MAGEQLEIGSSYSNSIKITFCEPITTFNELDKVVVELGIKREEFTPQEAISSDVRGKFQKGRLIRLNRWNAQQEFEYSRMGEFYISEQIDVNWNDGTTTLECSDALIFTESTYTTNLKYPAQLRDMIKEATDNVGLVLDYLNYDNLPDLELNKLADGELTNRKALEQLSQFVVGYVKINRFGYLEIKSFEDNNYSIDPEYYFSKGLTKNDIRYKVGGITCTVENSELTIELHSGNYTGIQISVENKLMTQELLDNIYNKLSSIEYYPYSLSWRGNPALEVGDYITVSDLQGNVYKVPNISYSLEFNGSLKASSKADTVSLTDIVSSTNSPLLKKITKSVNQVKVENINLSEKVAEVNDSVIEINKAIEDADIQGIKDNIAKLLSVTESFIQDLEELDTKINGFDIPNIKKLLEQLKLEIDGFPLYTNVSIQNDGLFTKEDYQVFLNHISYLNDIVTGTGWLTLTSAYTSEGYSPRFRKRNNRVELQFSLKGFTAENQIAVTLPVGSRSQRKIQKTTLTTSGKYVIINIETDGSVRIAKVFSFSAATTAVSSEDVFMIDAEFPID